MIYSNFQWINHPQLTYLAATLAGGANGLPLRTFTPPITPLLLLEAGVVGVAAEGPLRSAAQGAAEAAEDTNMYQ